VVLLVGATLFQIRATISAAILLVLLIALIFCHCQVESFVLAAFDKSNDFSCWSFEVEVDDFAKQESSGTNIFANCSFDVFVEEFGRP
jgi:hypothetical protein